MSIRNYWKYWIRGWIILLLFLVLLYSLRGLISLLMELLQTEVYYAPAVVLFIVFILWVTVGAACCGWLFELAASRTKRIGGADSQRNE